MSPTPSFFTEQDYNVLHEVVFRADYPGYRPAVAEAPNGDGVLDTQKRYSHIATKYLKQFPAPGAPHYRARMNERDMLETYLRAAHRRALEVAAASGLVPQAFLPSFEHSALRVLEYPAGASSAPHTDFDLFTLNLYRNVSNYGLGPVSMPVHMGELGEVLGLGPAFPHFVAPLDRVQRSIVYFCIPDHAAVLPSGQNAGEWIAERIARSRYDK